MSNPNPTKRARRLEMRRKELGGGDPSCFDCGESDLSCLELDHPVGWKRDRDFERVRCRNCHRKREMERDLAGLTKNGLHDTRESASEALCSYQLLLALDQELMADLLESSPASAQRVATAMRATAASLRRKAKRLPKSYGTRDNARPTTRALSDICSRPQPRQKAKATDRRGKVA